MPGGADGVPDNGGGGEEDAADDLTVDDADAGEVHFLRLARRRGWIANCRVHRNYSRHWPHRTPVPLEVETQVRWKQQNSVAHGRCLADTLPRPGGVMSPGEFNPTGDDLCDVE